MLIMVKVKFENSTKIYDFCVSENDSPQLIDQQKSFLENYDQIRLSVHAETKLANFDKKIKEIEIMVSLLEFKLNSLPPEITSKYPPLTYSCLNDINPQILSTNIYEIKSNEVKEEVTQQPVKNNIVNI